MALHLVAIILQFYTVVLSIYVVNESSIGSVITACLVVALVEFLRYFIHRKGVICSSALVLLPVILAASSITFFIAAILLGAPLLSYCEETLLLSLLVSLLAILPLILCAAGNLPRLHDLVFEWRCKCEYERYQLAAAVGTVLGAWLGAFVIPLDWDRPWQVWPIPCCVGSLFGCGVARVATSVSAFVSPRLFVDNHRD